MSCAKLAGLEYFPGRGPVSRIPLSAVSAAVPGSEDADEAARKSSQPGVAH
jgi:hypothetical protein